MNIFNKFKNIISNSDFLKNLLTLVSGTSIAQALPILLSPVLTRMYSPEDFGVLAIFISISSIFGTSANLRYELAVLLPEKDEEALSIVYLGSIISAAVSIFLLIFLLFFHDWAVIVLESPNLKGWLYFVPVVVFLTGIYNMLNYYNTRINEYKSIAVSKVLKSVSMTVIQILFGILKFTKGGLILGFGSSNLFGNFQLLKNTLRNKELNSKVSKHSIKQAAVKYKRFPGFTFPATLANLMSTEFTNVLISTVFNVATLGFYSLSYRILGMPSAIIGASVGQVFMQEATNEKFRTGKADIIFKSVLRKLLYLGLPFFGILFFVSEELIAFVFGEEWRIAGVYAQIMIPLLFIRFISVPVSTGLIVFEQQLTSMLWQFGLLIISISAIALAFIFKMNFINFLYIFVSSLVIYYVFLLYISYNAVIGKRSFFEK